jgi:hypothetical protein
MNTHMNISAIVGRRVGKKGVDNSMEGFIMSICPEFGYWYNMKGGAGTYPFH